MVQLGTLKSAPGTSTSPFLNVALDNYQGCARAGLLLLGARWFDKAFRNQLHKMVEIRAGLATENPIIAGVERYLDSRRDRVGYKIGATITIGPELRRRVNELVSRGLKSDTTLTRYTLDNWVEFREWTDMMRAYSMQFSAINRKMQLNERYRNVSALKNLMKETGLWESILDDNKSSIDGMMERLRKS